MNTQILKTEQAISLVKRTFESELSKELTVTKISAPIVVLQGTGINDDLNGVERTVNFPVKSLADQQAVVVNSLAKWKRMRLKEIEIQEDKGILTDMKALRPDEDYSPIHSIYVDQWDWEKRIAAESRTLDYLKKEVQKIYKALKTTEAVVIAHYDEIVPVLPKEIRFIHSEELLQLYPNLSPKQREFKITEKYGAVFLMGIGNELTDGKPHDGRAPDYDDWISKNKAGYFGLNGDILVWHPVLKESFEISSMGIRVDKFALEKQLEKRGQTHRKNLQFHQMLLGGKLPESIGGGIGQSRICMFLLQKKHIGEVQVGIWPSLIRESAKKEGALLL